MTAVRRPHDHHPENTLGAWNPAWGPRPEIQRPPTPPPHKPKYRVYRIVCPNGCNEPVTTRGPEDAIYECAACATRMTVSRVVSTRKPPKTPPTSVNAGERYGRLVVQSLDRDAVNLRAVVVCDCGVTKLVWAKSLRSGQTRSCGCLRRESSLTGDHPWRYSYKTRGQGQ